MTKAAKLIWTLRNAVLERFVDEKGSDSELPTIPVLC
jgi:hypothetical protein